MTSLFQQFNFGSFLLLLLISDVCINFKSKILLLCHRQCTYSRISVQRIKIHDSVSVIICVRGEQEFESSQSRVESRVSSQQFQQRRGVSRVSSRVESSQSRVESSHSSRVESSGAVSSSASRVESSLLIISRAKLC